MHVERRQTLARLGTASDVERFRPDVQHAAASADPTKGAAALSLSVVKQPLVRRVPATAIAFPLIAGIFTSRRVNTGTGAASEFTFFCRMSAFICPPKKDNMLQ